MFTAAINNLNLFKLVMTGRKVIYQKPPEWVPGLYKSDRNFQNKIVLSFDDGPSKDTKTILAILRKHNIKAVFFIRGCVVENGRQHKNKVRLSAQESQEIIRMIVSEGHTLGNHSYTHNNFGKTYFYQGPAGVNNIKVDLEKAQNIVNKVLGNYNLIYIRPPFGDRSCHCRFTQDRAGNFDLAVKALGPDKRLIMWQVNPEDYNMYVEDKDKGKRSELPPDVVKERIYAGIEKNKGGVILLHDTEKTAKILDSIVTNIKLFKNKQGKYSFGNIDELLKIKYKKN